MLRILKDRAEAEEALQEVYVKIWQRADRYVAWRLQPDQLAGGGRAQPLPRHPAGAKAPSEDIDLALDVADGGPDPEQASIASGERGRIDACLETLEPTRRTACAAPISTASATKNWRTRHNGAAQHDANLAAAQPDETEGVPFGMSTDSEHSGGPEDDRVLVAEYALGLLDGREHVVMAHRIAAEPQLSR
jgi:hypothetical protein